MEKPAEGVIIESYLDSKRGPTATLLVRDGVLRAGDIAATRSTMGKVKILEDFQGEALGSAPPSTPAIVIGFEEAPQVGDKFEVYPDIKSAQKYIEKKERKDEEVEVLFIEEGKKVLNIIIESLKDLPQEKVVLRILKSEVGDVNESDVKLAKSGKASIIGFRVKTTPTATVLAERDKVSIRNFEIIYELIQQIRNLMEKNLGEEKVKVEVGELKAIAIFLTDKNRQIVGGKVTSGEVRRGTQIEVFRREEYVGRGKIVSLQKNKKDVDKVAKGEECGILYEGDVKVEAGDVLNFYVEEKRKGDL